MRQQGLAPFSFTFLNSHTRLDTIDISVRNFYHLGMAKLNYLRALSEVESGKLDRSYILIGEDYHQRFLLTEKIIQQKLPASERALNKHRLLAKQATPDKLQELLAGVPLFGGSTVVVVSDLDKLPAKSQELLPTLLKALDYSVTFVGSARKLDGRTKFTRAIAAVSTTVEIKQIFPDRLPEYVRARFAAREMMISADAAEEFARIVGSDCGDIENEVEKLSIVHDSKSQLEIADVESYLSGSRFYSQYEVADHLGSRNLREALAATRQFLESSGASGRGQLFWAFYNQLERILNYKAYSQQMSRENLARKLGMHPFFLQKLQRHAARYTPAQLADSLKRVYQAEVEDRFSQFGKEQIFERMLVDIMQASGE